MNFIKTLLDISKLINFICIKWFDLINYTFWNKLFYEKKKIFSSIQKFLRFQCEPRKSVKDSIETVIFSKNGWKNKKGVEHKNASTSGTVNPSVTIETEPW